MSRHATIHNMNEASFVNIADGEGNVRYTDSRRSVFDRLYSPRVFCIVLLALLMAGCGGGSSSGFGGVGGCGDPKVDVTGSWSGSAMWTNINDFTPGRKFDIFLRQDDGKLSGMVSSPECLVETPIVGGEVKDAGGILEVCGIEHDITFKAEWEVTKISFFGTVFIDGDLISANYVLESSSPRCPQVETGNVFLRKG